MLRGSLRLSPVREMADSPSDIFCSNEAVSLRQRDVRGVFSGRPLVNLRPLTAN